MLYLDLLLAALLATLIGRVGAIGALRDRFTGCRLAEWCAMPAAAGLVVSFAFELRALWQQAMAGRGSHLPLPVLDDGAVLSSALQRFSTTLAALAVAQTLLLLVVYLSLRGRPVQISTRSFLAISALVLIGAALGSPLLTSADAYSYVGYALPGVSAYAPPAAQFSGEFFAINQWWGTPLVAAPYGPAFIVYDRLVTALVPGLIAKIEMLRLANVGWLLVSFCALRLCRVDWRVVALLALNPLVALQFIVSPHNDLAAVTLCILAIATGLRYPLVAAALVVLSGLWKLPFALIGLVAFSSGRFRLFWGAVVLGCTVALSLLLGRTAYVQALINHIHERSNFIDAAHFAVAFLATGTILTLIALRRRFAIATYLIPALAGGIFPWYAIWGLPYAALKTNELAAVLIALPFFAFLMESVADTAPVLLAVFILLLSACLIVTTRAILSRRSPATLQTLAQSE